MPLHLGDLHSAEQALVVVLAFGPVVVLAVVVALVRRRDLAVAADPADAADEGAPQRDR